MESAARAEADLAGQSSAAFDLSRADSFEAFYRCELSGLVAFARALSGSAAAEDIAQDAMLAAYRRWDLVGGLDAPGAWVRRVCANRAVSTLRRRQVEARALLRLGSRRSEAEPDAAEHRAFWAEVRRLPRRQAQVVALHYVYDLGIAEIAMTLDCAEGTVKVHLSRARAALSSRFETSSTEQS
jgi:RNA polymerase sigma-70 factor (ECF subfamily)